MKIQHTQKNAKMNIPFDGEIETDENGIVEVSEAAAKELCHEGSLWTNLDTKIEEINEEDEENLDNELSVDLEILDLPAMIEVAKQAELDGWEKFQKNEKAMRTYLSKRLK